MRANALIVRYRTEGEAVNGCSLAICPTRRSVQADALPAKVDGSTVRYLVFFLFGRLVVLRLLFSKSANCGGKCGRGTCVPRSAAMVST